MVLQSTCADCDIRDDMKQVFDPTVAEIIKLVQTQKMDIEKTGKKLDVSFPLDPSPELDKS